MGSFGIPKVIDSKTKIGKKWLRSVKTRGSRPMPPQPFAENSKGGRRAGSHWLCSQTRKLLIQNEEPRRIGFVSSKLAAARATEK
jgi:hypothetical protein